MVITAWFQSWVVVVDQLNVGLSIATFEGF